MVVWFVSAQVALAAGSLALLRAWRLRQFAVTATSWWGYVAIIGGPLLIVAIVSMLPAVLAAARMRPRQEGIAGDLTTDLGVQNTPLTSQHIALALSATIVLVMLAIGIGSSNPLAGLARGVVDAGLCMIGFTVLGAYLGLRTTS